MIITNASIGEVIKLLENSNSYKKWHIFSYDCMPVNLSARLMLLYSFEIKKHNFYYHYRKSSSIFFEENPLDINSCINLAISLPIGSEVFL